MWVSARGDVETYASQALQSRLEDWFVKGGIADEAKELVKRQSGEIGGRMRIFEDDAGEEEGEKDGGEQEQEDVFLDSTTTNPDKGRSGRPLAPLNTAIANQHFLRSRSSFPHSTLSHPSLDAPRTSPGLLSTSSGMVSRNSISSSPTPTPLHEIRLNTFSARTAFLELRFGQLQQGVCKTVAKAWIKMIQPKKQTRCPYNKGEAGKPDWWPACVRHKEPDHLMKAERHALLLTILRSPRVKVARLQLATAEVVALIKADKVSLLMDVYRVAREEEKMRERKAAAGVEAVEGWEGEKGEEEEVKVRVGTLDGWCKEASQPTSQGRQIARSVTPPPPPAPVPSSQGRGKEEGGMKKGKKRTAGSMTKSFSTGANFNKRRSIATTTPSSSSSSSWLAHDIFPQSPHNNTIFNYHPPHSHSDAVGLGLLAPIPRSYSFSSAPAHHTQLYTPAGRSCETSRWPPQNGTFAEVNGLTSALTATSTSIDPAFAPHTDAHTGQFYYAHPHHAPQSLYAHTARDEISMAYQHDALALDLAGAAMGEGWDFGGLDISQMADLEDSSWGTVTATATVAGGDVALESIGAEQLWLAGHHHQQQQQMSHLSLHFCHNV
ncbi:uncharacterized protein UBRO_05623 [Ustilago bromivora]|uniref:Subtelomeric hrmA-associated cluster protein AFUB-079030/YDR124W-like helical bundle domain-containing protein n=1 Tax=Ustilago bromivora TaxID=307758 RepID=A0A1K0GUU0_9BASI|nr:uncharacterized protein UBRO_05623 [Ustilago bromivora]